MDEGQQLTFGETVTAGSLLEREGLINDICNSCVINEHEFCCNRPGSRRRFKVTRL